MAGIPALTGDPRTALIQSMLMGGRTDTPGAAIGSIGRQIVGALLARQAGAERERRQTAVNQAIMSALGGAGGTVGSMAPGAAAPGVAAAGGAGFSTGPTQQQITAQLLMNPDFITDPRAPFVLQQLQPPESDVRSPERQAQELELIQARRPPATTINVGPQGQQFGNAPPGTVWARNQDGSIMVRETETPGGGTAFAPVAVPIVGGPVEAEQQAAAAEAAQAEERQRIELEREQMTAEMLVDDIDRIGQLVQSATLPTTGLAGGVLANIGGTAARDIRALLDTVKANIGFDQLKAMRAASPTGASGLGQLTERELSRLEALMGNLEQSQTQDQFLRNLDRVREEFNMVVHGQRQPPGTSSIMPDPSAMPRPTTQEGYDALPEGAWYIDPVSGQPAQKGQ